MSGLVPLQPNGDLNDPVARNSLQESLFLMSNRIRLLTEELEQVKEADKIVRPVPIEAFPVAAGQIYTGEGGGNVGDIVFRAAETQPDGFLQAVGTAVEQATYPDLYALIGSTFNTGGETGTQFRLPDLRGRAPVGATAGGVTCDATGSTISWTVGLKQGDERTEAHDHGLNSHTHDISHTHAIGLYAGGGAGGLQTAGQNPSAAGLGNQNTGPASTSTSGAASGNTAGAFNGTSKNTQPSLGLAPYIRYAKGPRDVTQTLPLNWGEVNAQWQLDTVVDFPTTGVENLDLQTDTPVIDNVPEAVVRVSAADGAQSGSMGTDNRIVGVIRVPYNFRAWRPNALAIRTKVNSTGITTNESCTITLRVSDPLNPGTYLSKQFTRTISESGGSIADSEYEDAVLTAEDLGRTWKPGYMLRFELIFDHPKTFTTAQLDVGLLKVNWR